MFDTSFASAVASASPIGEVELPARVADLVRAFMADKARYRSTEFKEMSLRSEFLNPLFEELGWDPTNSHGQTYDERDVVQEPSVLIDGKASAPDYAMVLGGRRRLFVEAKRPSVNIEDRKDSAFQIRRYGWSAGIPFGIITDFEEFAIYDCRQMPAASDGAAVARIAYFTCDELEQWWPTLVAMFSRDAVANGSLEKIAADRKSPQGTRTVDVQFLDEIQSWRRDLAADIAVRNPALDVVDLSTAVQTLIDRIVFLRTVEARGLESRDALETAARENQGPGVYSRLLKLFRRADDRYNSGLFHLNTGTGLNDIGLSVSVSDEILRSIIAKLYFPYPYEFSVLPPDILGRIYEQFLGEAITLNDDRSTIVELKPEHRKSGGVYYTPAPIVEYIVDETLGPLLAGQTPARVKGLTVVDPASGSGSFLLIAFQYLLDWHREYYAAHPMLAKRFLETGADNQTRIKTFERKRILLDHIYGVDIDRQAVEVTKLSLLLKVLEGQSQDELDIGRILPDLDGNIVCGNSLIGTDFHVPFGLTEEESLAFNPFSWTDAFPKVFKAGGFDAVIGNPPYLNIDNVWGKKDPRLAYIKAAYPEVYTDKTDILFYFIKKAVDICRGEIGLIVSRSFLEADKAQKLRGWMSTKAHVRSVLDFRDAQVFPGVGINTAIVRLTHSRAAKSARFARFKAAALPPGYQPATFRDAELVSEISVPSSQLSSTSWNFGDASVEAVLAKIDRGGDPVGDILHIGQGMQTAANEVFQFKPTPQQAEILRKAGLLYRRARNSEIWRYRIASNGVDILYLEDVKSFNKLPSFLQEHLNLNKKMLTARAAFKRGNCDWWRYSWPIHKEFVKRPKILSPYLAAFNRFALDDRQEYLGISDTTVLYDNGQPEDLRYILGFLNSQILSARFSFIGKLRGGGALDYFENTIRRLPIPRRAPGDPDYDAMVELVARRIEVEAEAASTRVAEEEAAAIMEAAELDLKIEGIVARLFGLSGNDLTVLGISELLVPQSD